MRGVHLIGIALGLLVLGIFIGGFAPKPEQRVIFDGARYRMVEDYSTNTICLFDKREQQPPDCKPIRERGTSPFNDYPGVGEEPNLPPPVPSTFPDEP